jgi:hypothetical protein
LPKAIVPKSLEERQLLACRRQKKEYLAPCGVSDNASTGGKPSRLAWIFEVEM